LEDIIKEKAYFLTSMEINFVDLSFRAQKFDSYVEYCTNKPHSTQLLVAHDDYFVGLQRRHNLEHQIAAYLIKPVQRITKYQLLLKDLLSCCDQLVGEIREGLEVCLNVPKKANDALHLSMLEGCDVSHDTLGEVVLQDSFQVWDPKQLIRKAKDRHIFLFELYLVFSKEIKDSNGKSKYVYKSKLMVSLSCWLMSFSYFQMTNSIQKKLILAFSG
jgi:triple functional domain protein